LNTNNNNNNNNKQHKNERQLVIVLSLSLSLKLKNKTKKLSFLICYGPKVTGGPGDSDGEKNEQKNKKHVVFIFLFQGNS
jgi:hypothetical protein